MAEIAERDYTEELLDHAERVERCIVVFFYGRSGSYLLCSFLDNHPHVLQTVPLGVQDAHNSFDRLQRAVPANASPELLAQKVCEEFPNLFGTNLGTLGRLENERAVDRPRFEGLLTRAIRSAVERGVQINGTFLFSALHLAYRAALDLPITTPDPVIVWNYHVPVPYDRFKFARTLYPKARFMVCIRNPWQTLDSHFHAHLVDSPMKPFVTMTGKMLVFLLLSGELYEGETKETLAGVRFEDLHESPEATMRSVAAWIGIPWHPSLLVSSFNGETWWVTRDDGVEFTGARPSQAKPKKAKHLTFFDKLLLGWVLVREYKEWGYDNAFFERNKELLRPLIEELLIHFPTGMELAALRAELVEIFKAYWEQRQALREFFRQQAQRRESPEFRVLPLLDLDSPS
ncbi:MAG: sulfotransferase [Candidatus Eremiobacteraeota bacterium]|nr:sulfotransferase [Candidatus Eremiobacteraeota bacterium]